METFPVDEMVDALWNTFCGKSNIHSEETAKLNSLSSKLSASLTRSEICDLADRFSYEEGDILPQWGKVYRLQGYLTLDQAYLIRKWKTARGSRVFYRKNGDRYVRFVTRLAARAASRYRNSPAFPNWILGLMEQVAVPTASAFLAALSPEDFGIIDYRVWSSMVRLTNNMEPKTSNYTLSDFHSYTMLLRCWGSLESITPRTLDKALWQLDKEFCEN